MEKLLIIMGGFRLAGRGSLRGQIDSNPDLGFLYDGLHYEPSKGTAFKLYGGEQTDLLDDEIRLIEAYIDAFRFRVWLLGGDGLPYAQAYHDEALNAYAHCLPPALPEHYWYNPISGQWDIIYGVDAGGKYIGNVPLIQCAHVANCRPSFDYERWDEVRGEWLDARSLPEMKDAAKAQMRGTANAARSSGLLFNGTVWASTPHDFDALTACGYDAPSWPDADGDPVALDGFKIPDIVSAMRAYFDECEARYAAACAAIDAAADAGQLVGVEF